MSSRHAEAARGGATAEAQASGRMSAEDRRRQIVQVAMELFAESGFRGTTTKEISQAAGVSEAIIFRHFATKEELYTAIIDFKSCEGLGAGLSERGGTDPVAEKIRALVGQAMERGDDPTVFETIARAMMEHHRQDPQFLRLLLYSALEGHELAQIFWDRNVRVMYAFLGDYIRRRQREGAFRDVDPRVVVRAFTGTIIHHSLNNTLWDTDPVRRILDIPNEEAAREFSNIILKGIAAASPGAGGRNARAKRASSKAKSKRK